MTDATWVYLAQLVRSLQQEGVDGRRIGEMVVEIEQHLEDSAADPVSEFGPPAQLAQSLAQRPGTRRPGWVPPLWLTYLAVTTLLLVVVPLLAPYEWTDTTIPVTAGAVSYVIVFSTVVFWFGYNATRRLDGRTWRALTGWRFALSVLGLAVVVSLLFSTGSERTLFELPKVEYLVFVAIVGPALMYVLIRHNNPVRFPDNAQHLNRLKWGILAGRPPAAPEVLDRDR
ncbi:MAG: hypothetical protein QNJ77_00090 [Acidimicrobiia bacterium]|nr:hypothetical protein [Acidimicrobiia bacterium]